MIAHAMYALECEMVPGEVDDEGPFAEVTGYYAKRAPRPVVHVKAIHHRKQPVFQTILSGVEVWNSVGLLGEANVLALLQRQVPGVRDVYFSHGGCGFYHCIVALRPVRAGWSKQAIMATFAAFPPLKMVTVVDDDVDIRNPIGRRVGDDHPPRSLDRRDHDPGLLRPRPQPELSGLQGTKIGFDCTRPFPYKLRLRPRRLQAGLARRLRPRRRWRCVAMDGRALRFAYRPAKAGSAFAGHARSSAALAARVKDLSTGAAGALRASLTRAASAAIATARCRRG